MLDVFGILSVMECCADDMHNEKYTYNEINRYLHFPNGVDPFEYLSEKRNKAYELSNSINPKTKKPWASLDIAKEIGIIG